MRAIWMSQGGVELRDVPEPELGSPTDVEVRVLEVGVCGTDRELIASGLEPPAGQDGLVLGHEALGQVTACGAAVGSVRSGDLVALMVRLPCPHGRCGPCRSGRQDFCLTGDYRERGIKGAHGFMAERVVLPEADVIRVPAALRSVGVLVEPLTIAEKALDQVRSVQERLPAPGLGEAGAATGSAAPHRQSALVLGAGPVGLLGVMALLARGYRTSLFSREPPGGARARLATAIGAEYLSGEVPLAEARGRLEPFDLVYEATGAAQATLDALALLAPNGVFVLAGVPGRRGPISFDAARALRDLVLGNRALVGTINAGRRHFAAAVGDLALFAAAWPEALAALVTGRFPLERAAEALEHRPGAVKQVVLVAPAEG